MRQGAHERALPQAVAVPECRENLPRYSTASISLNGDAPARGYSRMKAWISSGVALPSLLASTWSKIRL
jgi:hypothetical protein